jgi:hypothetical protein
MAISDSVRFWLYLIPLIPSIILTIFDLHYLRISRAFGTTLKHHDTFLLLTCVLIGELSDVIWNIHYYRTGTALSSKPAFYLIWVFFDSFLLVLITILMAWASIERHILIFYPNWLATKRKLFLPLSSFDYMYSLVRSILFCHVLHCTV